MTKTLSEEVIEMIPAEEAKKITDDDWEGIWVVQKPVSYMSVVSGNRNDPVFQSTNKLAKHAEFEVLTIPKDTDDWGNIKTEGGTQRQVTASDFLALLKNSAQT